MLQALATLQKESTSIGKSFELSFDGHAFTLLCCFLFKIQCTLLSQVLVYSLLFHFMKTYSSCLCHLNKSTEKSKRITKSCGSYF